MQPGGCTKGTVKISAAIDAGLKRALEQAAAREDVTQTEIIERLIREHL